MGMILQSKTIVYLVYFFIYAVILLIVGKVSIRGTSTVRQFYVGDRKLGLISCVLTFVGTWISAATILGFTGSVFESGLSTLMYSVFPWFVGAILLLCISKRIYANDVLTIPELFAKKYNSKGLQVCIAVLMIVVYILYLVIQIKGFGLVASYLFDIPYSVSALMIYLFILYATFGGYRSVTRTDAFNTVALSIGLAIILGIVVGHVGGIGEVFRQATQVSGLAHTGMEYANQPGDLFKLFNEGKFSPFASGSMFFGWGLGLAANPQYVIRLISAKNQKTARRTVICSIVYLTVFYLALLVIGLGIRVIFPTLEQVTATDDIFAYVISDLLYSPLSGVFLFTVMGACISTANSQLLLISTSFAYDIVATVSKKPLHEQKLLSLSRLGILIGGAISLLLSMNPPESLLIYGGDIWGIFGVTLFPALYGTLCYKKSTRQGIWGCLFAGAASITVFYPLYYLGVLPVHPALPATVLSSLSYWILSRTTWKRGEDHAL